MRAAAITFTCMAACAVSLAGPLSRQATADDNPAHALADKFARAAQQAEQAQAEKKAEEAAKKEEAERARLAAEASERRKAEAQKAEAQRRAEYEADMLRRASLDGSWEISVRGRDPGASARCSRACSPHKSFLP